MASEKHHILPVWFFVGVLFVIYGALTLASGISEWNSPPSDIALANLHASVWWGAVMLVVGLIYTIAFRPRRG
jgi:hypothetical protein